MRHFCPLAAALTALQVPSHLPSSDSVDVQIYLLYPSSPSFDIKNLVTSLPLYTQAFDGLSPTVVFDTLSVYGSRGDIWCDVSVLWRFLRFFSLADAFFRACRRAR